MLDLHNINGLGWRYMAEINVIKMKDTETLKRDKENILQNVIVHLCDACIQPKQVCYYTA